MDDTQSKCQTWLVCTALAVAIVAAYLPLWHSGFVAYDDNDYVTANEMVKRGVSWPGIVWAFTTFHASNWHPLAWLSHIVDFQLYQLNPTGHHITSLLLHVANSILLFLLLRGMTGGFWRSALTAAFFALHPLHVESVAWISERKDVLSTFFWLLAVWAYVRYTRDSNAKKFYAWSVILFALGLMAKPMLVTLPLVLLLLDYWPLRRLEPPRIRLLIEKIPYFVLSALSCVITLLAQESGGATSSLARVPLAARLENVPMALVRYIGKTFWPSDLAVLYPYDFHWPLGEVVGAIILLAIITAFAWRRAWSTAGWLWFLVMLLPVIGLVQAGPASMADRYSYLANAGLFIVVIWTLRLKPTTAGVIAGVALAGCMVLTFRQASYWKNSETLFSHTLAVTKNNAIIESNLGKVFSMDDRMDEALPHLQRAVALDPNFALAHFNLGEVLLAKDRIADALEQFDDQTRLQPNDPIAQYNFGSVLLEHGLAADALPHLEKAMQLQPHNVQAASSLAWLLATAPPASLRNGARAVPLAQLANDLSGGQDPKLLGILAAAYAEARDFPKAVTTAERALQLAGPEGKTALADLLRRQLALYRASSPYRDARQP